MAWTTVCGAAELPPGSKVIVDVDGREIVVARVGDDILAVRNICPHQGAPLGEGRLSGTMVPSAVGEFCYGREGEILRCPWHGFEFDMRTGRSLHDPARMRVKSYAARTFEGDVQIQI